MLSICYWPKPARDWTYRQADSSPNQLQNESTPPVSPTVRKPASVLRALAKSAGRILTYNDCIDFRYIRMMQEKELMESKDCELKEEQDRETRTLEESLKELQQIVVGMESGDQSLETSLDEFERGINLIRQCQRKLEQAQQRVDILTAKNDEDTITPFQHSQSD